MQWDDEFLYKYKAWIERVVDADTIHVVVDLGMRSYIFKEVRVVKLGGGEYDAPETRLYSGVTEEEKAKGLEAKRVAETIFPEDTEIRLVSHKDSTGKYGRLLATPFFYENNQWVNYTDYMIGLGYDTKN